MALKLRTFVTSNGLMDFVVATTSKAKALAAWGVGQDLFKGGQAQETEDPMLVEAATAQPGKVVQRPASTQAAIRALQPAKVSTKPKPPPASARSQQPSAAVKVVPLRPAPKPPEPTGPTPAQLRKAAEAEEKLNAARANHKAVMGDLAVESETLDSAMEALRADLKRVRKELAALEKKQAQIELERESVATRTEQERKRFNAQEAILRARLDAAKSAQS